MAETAGCQMWGIIGRLLVNQEVDSSEIDAVKRRLFAFPDQAEEIAFSREDIANISDADDLRWALGEYSAKSLAEMFF